MLFGALLGLLIVSGLIVVNNGHKASLPQEVAMARSYVRIGANVSFYVTLGALVGLIVEKLGWL